jgi:Holliday junction resolvase
MGKSQRDKGARVEREFVNMHKTAGIHAERVPMSGASAYTHDADIDVYAFGKDEAPLICEVKARKNGAGFKTIEDWLGENDALFLKRNNAEPMVVVPWRVWQRLVSS